MDLEKAAQRAGIEHAKQNDERAYLGRKPSFTREQFKKVRDMLGQEAIGIAQIAKETGLTRQTVYRIKGDPAGAEAASPPAHAEADSPFDGLRPSLGRRTR